MRNEKSNFFGFYFVSVLSCTNLALTKGLVRGCLD